MLGLRLRAWVPGHHLSPETKDAVRVGMSSVATMAALVLGLLVATTKSAFDVQKAEVIQMASKVTYLDQVLANCGPQSAESRQLLRRAVQSAVWRIWPEAAVGQDTPAPASIWSQDLPRAIQRIPVSDDAQRAFKTQAAALANDVGQMRWLLFEQTQSSISFPLLLIMAFWLALTFLSVGLFAPPNATVIAAQALAALAVAGAIFLILELDQPFRGVFTISHRPMMDALSRMVK
jgi:hypothetical protein